MIGAWVAIPVTHHIQRRVETDDRCSERGSRVGYCHFVCADEFERCSWGHHLTSVRESRARTCVEATCGEVHRTDGDHVRSCSRVQRVRRAEVARSSHVYEGIRDHLLCIHAIRGDRVEREWAINIFKQRICRSHIHKHVSELIRVIKSIDKGECLHILLERVNTALFQVSLYAARKHDETHVHNHVSNLCFHKSCADEAGDGDIHVRTTGTCSVNIHGSQLDRPVLLDCSVLYDPGVAPLLPSRCSAWLLDEAEGVQHAGKLVQHQGTVGYLTLTRQRSYAGRSG